MLGAAYSLILYYREKRLEELPKALLGLLAFLRFAAVSVIAFLLMEPVIRSLQTRIEQPVLILAADNSQSLVLSVDSAELASDLNQIREEFSQKLGSDFELAFYSFGDEMERDGALNFSEPITDFSKLFEGVSARYSNRNLAGIVLASDGIYNRGTNPRYAAGNLGVPVYTIALGDTTVRRDARIEEFVSNRIAFLGNTFPVEVRAIAEEMEGESLEIQIYSDGELVEKEEVQVKGSRFEIIKRFLIKAESPGIKTLRARITPKSDEVTLANNQSNIFIEIVDSRKKVLLLANSPHPDVFALNQAINANENYELEIVLEKDFKGNFDDYDLLILHQIPSARTTVKMSNEILASEVPVLAILGENTVVAKFRLLEFNLSLSRGKDSYIDAKGTLNPGFSLFKLDDNLKDLLRQTPPLRIAFGEWNTGFNSEVLLYQLIGPVETNDPLVYFSTNGDKKSAAVLGEGLWRWRLTDYALHENHDLFNGLIASIIQYLAVEEDKRLFRVQSPRSIMENENLILTADLYNAALEPVNDVDVAIEITDEDGKSYPFNFSKSNEGYRLDAGRLPVGVYSYRASTARNGENLVDAGSFTIKPFALEAASLRADHRLLYNIAQVSGGEMKPLARAGDLIQTIQDAPASQPVSYSTEILDSILNLKWVFVLILGLLSMEWFIRKRSGHY
jgi:hypothetical protein